MTLVSHMLLGAFGCFELTVTEEAHFSQLDSLRTVCKEAFEVGKALDIENGEVVLPAHIVQVALHARALLVTEETDAE